MPIPDFQTCMRPLLATLADGQTHHFNDAFEKVCQFFQLTEAERAERLPSGKQTVIRNRVSWSRTYLKKAGLLHQPQRSYIAITEQGLKALEDCPERITVRYLKQFEAFDQFHSHTPASASPRLPVVSDEESTNPEERLEQAQRELIEALADELLQTIKAMPPQFFEKLVVDLMLAMGYGGNRKTAGRATQYTADGGIDGVINEDRLGLDTIYLQAKRYTDNTIGRPAVQQFAGALDMQRARKGVFITTSQFSREARDYVDLIDKQIVLIDGQQLAELMIEHNLGVSTKQVYTLQQIDTDYFTDD